MQHDLEADRQAIGITANVMDLANNRGSMIGCSLPGMKGRQAGRQSRGEARRTGSNEPLFLDERCFTGPVEKKGQDQQEASAR